MKVELLKKGTPLVYVCSESLVSKRRLEKDGITNVELKYGYWSVPCFVSGDTDELGLAIVALDNPEICLIKAEGSGRIRLKCMIERDAGVIHIEQLQSTGIIPICPYK